MASSDSSSSAIGSRRPKSSSPEQSLDEPGLSREVVVPDLDEETLPRLEDEDEGAADSG